MILINKRKVLSWLAVMVWMVIICILSSQPAKVSNQLSKNVTNQVLTNGKRIGVVKFDVSQNDNRLRIFNVRFRRYAHVGLYFVLGMLVLNAFRRSGIKGFNALFFSFVICMAYAVFDEMHQTFIPGRGAEAADLFRDGIGIILGIGLYSIGEIIKSGNNY